MWEVEQMLALSGLRSCKTEILYPYPFYSVNPFYSTKIFWRTLNQALSWSLADQDRMNTLSEMEIYLEQVGARPTWSFYENNAVKWALKKRNVDEEDEFKSQHMMVEALVKKRFPRVEDGDLKKIVSGATRARTQFYYRKSGSLGQKAARG